MNRWQLNGLVLAVVWLFIRGIPLNPAVLLQEALIGLAAGMLVAGVLRHMNPGSVDLRQVVAVMPTVMAYMASFLTEVLLANVDVARRVVDPRLPIHPAVITYPLTVKAPAAVTVLANSITLTPGTLTMDYDEHEQALLIHAIDGRDRDAVVAPINRWEELLLDIWGDPR